MLIRNFRRSSHVRQSSNGSLILGELRKTDAGWYLCEADNGVGSTLANYVQVKVIGKRRIRVFKMFKYLKDLFES